MSISFIGLYYCKSKSNLKTQNTLGLECGDVLEKLAQKPGHLEFLDCTSKNGQTIYEATYKVQGKYALEVEKFLVNNYHMEALIYLCCGWEVKNGKKGLFADSQFFKDGSSLVFQVSMFSEDTELKKREEWPQIPYFYVIAEISDI
ncbi:MAG: DUF4952 domain-containing protein [Leptospirales bacterium]